MHNKPDDAGLKQNPLKTESCKKPEKKYFYQSAWRECIALIGLNP